LGFKKKTTKKSSADFPPLCARS